MKMHEDQVDIDAELLRRLLDGQFPDLAGLTITRVRSLGSVNALFRIGDDLCARLPLLAEWEDSIDTEWEWLPRLARRIRSLAIPEPVFQESPTQDYPFRWAIHRWKEGETYGDEPVAGEPAAARSLARFVAELRSIKIEGSEPRAGRDPLAELDADTREAIAACGDDVDTRAAMHVWERS